MARDDRQRRSDRDRVVLEAHGIEKTYGSWLPFTRRIEVLRGVDLEIGRGSIVGIVGANGSGKSTLMRILVGALDADAGRVSVSGRVGWCPQALLLYEQLTVTETFRLFGEAYGMSPREVAGAQDRLASTLGFGPFLDRRVDRLSGGNRQKVNLSIALMHRPEILLLDEPYTGFDWETYVAFWRLTDQLVADGTAITVISHLISERGRFDRILALRDGVLHPEQGDV